MGETNLKNPTMHLFHIPQYPIQNINVYISVLNGALWDMEQVHCWICELYQFGVEKTVHMYRFQFLENKLQMGIS